MGRKIFDRVRALALPVVLAAGAVVFLKTVHGHTPIQHWLFWRYAGYWLACGALSLGCLSAGHVTVRRLLPAPLPIVEHLGTSFAVGVLELFLLLSVTGFLRLYGAVLFFALPLAMIAAGAVPLFRYLRRCARHVRHARRGARPTPWWTFAVLAFGLVALLMIYFLIITPENVQFDSRWKHMAIAEDYVVHGGIRRFQEGWILGTDPQLPQLLYTWAFMLPSGRLFDRVELAAHVEYFVFVATTLTIPALVRALLPRRGVEVGSAPGARSFHGLSWVARFVFPGVFLYDSSLSGGADHIAALFYVPMFLALLRAFRDLSPRRCVLLAAMVSGGILGKYTSLIMMLPPVVIALGVRGVQLAFRAKDRAPEARHHWWLGPVATLVTGLLLTAPHWLKNWVFYGDPLYPQLHAWLKLRPWTVDSADMFEWGYKDHQFWRPKRTLAGLWDTVKATFTFSFAPNDWPRFHGKVPVFGSLYTLLLACVPFFRGTKRVWALVGCIQAALFTWYWTHHQDRYLQTIVPWMAAVTAAVIIMLWRRGVAARAMVGALLAAQIAWAGDVYFIPTHAMAGSPIKATLDLLAKGYQKDYEGRFRTNGKWSDIGAGLPRGSVALLHDIHVHLGIGAVTVSDFRGWQYGISYGRQKTPRAVWTLLHKMGVTHLIWKRQASRGWDSVGGDLTFFDFALKYGEAPKRYDDMIVAAMPAEPPPDEPNDVVAFLGCNDGYASGLHRLKSLTVPVYGPKRQTYPKPFKAKRKSEPDSMYIEPAAFAVVDPKCHPDVVQELKTAGFSLAAKRKRIAGHTRDLELWIRGAAPRDEPVRAPGKPPPAAADDDDRDPFEPNPALPEPPPPEPVPEPTDAPPQSSGPQPQEPEPPEPP